MDEPSDRIEESVLAAFRDAGHALERDPSQVIGVALRSFLDVDPNVRRALLSIDDSADPAERSFASRLIGRAVLRAYEGILDNRYGRAGRLDSNASLDEDDAIEAEAVRVCAKA